MLDEDLGVEAPADVDRLIEEAAAYFRDEPHELMSLLLDFAEPEDDTGESVDEESDYSIEESSPLWSRGW